MAFSNIANTSGFQLQFNNIDSNNMATLLMQDGGTDTEKRKWQKMASIDAASESQPAKLYKDQYDESATTDISESNNALPLQRNPSDAQKSEEEIRQRRKEQNRAAQRAFRERRERHVKELEAQIEQMEKNHAKETEKLQGENKDLRDKLKRMETEMYALKGAAIAFDLSMNKLREAGIDVGSTLREISPPVSDQNRTPNHGFDKISPDKSLLSGADLTFTPQHQVPEPQTFDAPFFVAQDTPSRRSMTLESDCDMMEHDDCDKHAVLTTMEDQEFAESAVARFDHAVDPVVLGGANVIPIDEVWDRLAVYPNFQDCDVGVMCDEIKKKAKCSGTGAVITEEELEQIIEKMNRDML